MQLGQELLVQRVSVRGGNAASEVGNGATQRMQVIVVEWEREREVA